MPTAFSQENVILAYLQNYLGSDIKGDEQLSPIVRDSLCDMVRIAMREIAANEASKYSSAVDLVSQALTATLVHLNESTEGNVERIVDAYVTDVQESIKSAAIEISNLQLKDSEYQNVNADRRQFQLDSVDEFDVHTVGSGNDVKWLLAFPKLSKEAIEINMDALRSATEVKGNWFPFEIRIADMNFVLDDDGSIHVCVDNMPSSMLESSYQGIGSIISYTSNQSLS